MADVMELIKQHEADMIGIRRHIHANPELSNEENRTTALIREKLEEYGIEIMEIGLRPGEKMFEELRLDGEDTERTKNDLIFVNHVMRITRAEIDEKLNELARMIADKVPEPQLKQRLLEMIHDHEQQKAGA